MRRIFEIPGNVLEVYRICRREGAGRLHALSEGISFSIVWLRRPT